MDLQLSPPWIIYGKKLRALFRDDPDIEVSEVEKAQDKDGEYLIMIEARTHKKFDALMGLLPDFVPFGNIKLRIECYDTQNSGVKPELDLFLDLFEGNPAFLEFNPFVDPAGAQRNYLVFTPEVRQFHSDDFAELSGRTTMLYQDIAREIFAENTEKGNIFFVTEEIPE